MTETAKQEAVVGQLEDAAKTAALAPREPMQAGPPTAGELVHLERLAEYLSRSDLVPPKFRGKKADLLLVSLLARDLHIPTVAALTQIQVIDGVPGLKAELMRSIVRKRGHRIIIREANAARAVVWGKRSDTGDEMEASFTIQQAEAAGLCKIQEDGSVKARSQSNKALPWESYTEDMLVARASSRLCRRLFEDVLMGYTYTPEEAQSAAFEIGGNEPEPALPPVPQSGLPGVHAEWIERLQLIHHDDVIRKAAHPFWRGGEGDPPSFEDLESGDVPVDVRIQIARDLMAMKPTKPQPEPEPDPSPEPRGPEDNVEPAPEQPIAVLPPEVAEELMPDQAETAEQGPPLAGPRQDADHCWAHAERDSACTDCQWSGDAAQRQPGQGQEALAVEEGS